MKIQRAILRNISLYQQALEKSLSNLNFMDPGGVDEERGMTWEIISTPLF